MPAVLGGRLPQLLFIIGTLSAPIDVTESQAPPQPRTGCTGLALSDTGVPHPRMIHPVIDSVAAGSPAEIAGLRKGDVILAVDGTDARMLPRLFPAPPGTRYLVLARRGEGLREFEITAGTAMMALRRDGDPGRLDQAVCQPWLPGIS